MHPVKPFLVLVVIAALASGAGALLIVDAARIPKQAERAEEFQRLVGGLGFGPALDLARCPNSFDPRLDDGCADDEGSIPGGARFCPRHAGSIFYYPPLGPFRRTVSAGE
jgi:hypothetical protein